MDNKGQSILAEYIMIFFLVIGAATAITTFVQRGLQGRIHDAGHLMMDTANNALSQCDGCQSATGNVMYEYEPYYAQTNSYQYQNELDSSGLTNGSKPDKDVYRNNINSIVQTIANSQQLPPLCANGGC